MKPLNRIKLIIYTILLCSTIIALSSTNILIVWLCLELNLFSFVPLLLRDRTNKETEASITYFLAQALGSTLFLLRGALLLTIFWSKTYRIVVLIFSMIIKIGAAPCHYWYPITIELIRWINCFILSTWQKIAPLSILVYIITPNTKKTILLISIASSLSAVLGGISGLSQRSLKKIIAYSSITHIGWILRRPIIKIPHLSTIYLFLYSILRLPLFISFYKIKNNKVADLWHKQSIPTLSIIIISVMFLSLAGLPPLTGFIPKLLILYKLIDHSIILRALLVLGSLINLFFYLNICLNILIRNQQFRTNKKYYTPLDTRISIILPLNLIRLFILL